MSRRIMSIFLLTLLLVTVIGGGNAGAENAPPVKFTLWHTSVGADQRAKFMETMMSRFRSAYPDIEVIEEKIPLDQYRPKLKTMAAAGQLPEAFILFPNAMTIEFAKANLLSDINDLLEQNPEWKNSFVDAALNEFTVNGKTYSAGLGIAVCSIVYYNKSLFNKYKVAYPRTFSDWKKAVRVFKSNGIIPIAFGNKPLWPGQSTIFSCLANRETGSEWLTNVLTKQRGAKFSDAKFIKALKDLKELADLGAFNKDYNTIDNVQMRDYFYKGQAAMMIDGSWALTDIVNKTPAALMPHIELGIFPRFEGGNGDPNVMSGVSSTGVVINARATPRQKEAIKKLIMFLTNTDAQIESTKYDIPVSFKKIMIDPAKVSPVYLKLVELIKNHPLVTVYDSALNSEQTEIINNGLQAVMLGVQKPEALARQLQAAVK